MEPFENWHGVRATLVMRERDDVRLSDEQWAAVEPHIPRSTAPTGRPQADRRLMLEAMLHQLVTGCQWRRLPRGRFGPYTTVFTHFSRWRREGVFDKLVDVLRLEADRHKLIDWSALMADGTSVRASACAAGGRLGRGGSPRPAG